MPEDLIKPENVDVIKPTILIDLTPDIREKIKPYGTGSGSLNAEMLTSGIYITPDSPLNMFPGSHVIATVSYSQENSHPRMQILEQVRGYSFDSDVHPLVEILFETEEKTLKKVYSQQYDSTQLEKHQEIHEETHRMQEIRFHALGLKDKLTNIAKMFVDSDPKNERCIKSIEDNLVFTTWLELQAYQQSISSKRLKDENKMVHLLLTLSDTGVLFAKTEKGIPIAKHIFDTLYKGKMMDLDEGMVIPPHALALAMLLLKNVDLPNEIQEGKLSYDQFTGNLKEGLRTLIKEPEKLLNEISSKEFTIQIDQKLLEYAKKVKTTISETSTD